MVSDKNIRCFPFESCLMAKMIKGEFIMKKCINWKKIIQKALIGALAAGLITTNIVGVPYIHADDDDYGYDDDWDDDYYDDDWDDDDWDDDDYYDDDWDDDDWDDDDYYDDWDDDDWDDDDYDDDWDDDDWEDYYEDHYEALYGDDWEDAFERYYGVDVEDYIEAMYGEPRNYSSIDWNQFKNQTQGVLEGNNDYTKDPKFEGVDPNVTAEDAPSQGFEAGHRFEIAPDTYVVVKDLGIRSDKPVPELSQMNKEQLYEKAKQEQLANLMSVDVTRENNQSQETSVNTNASSGNEARPSDETGQVNSGEEAPIESGEQASTNQNQVQSSTEVIPVKANEKTVNDFNNIDVNVLNSEFLALLNSEREAAGLQPVSYGAHLQEGTDKRSTDLASIGDISVNNQPHVRLDGTSFREDFNYLEQDAKNGLGENLAMVSYSGNPHTLVSEKQLAEQFFNQWKKSPSHYQNMMSPDYQHSAVSVKMGENNQRTDGLTNSIVAVQILDTNTAQ